MGYLGTSPSKTTPTYKQVYEYTAAAGQTTFTASYTAGYVSVFRNGVQLSSPDFTATNGTSVVLANACTSGDAIRIESMFVNSQLNAIPNTAGAVATSNIADNAITTAKIAPGAVIPADLAQPLTSGTAVASTSGTSIDFTGIPSWAKRVTIMFFGVSTAANSYIQVRVGSGSIATTGYVGYYSYVTNAGATSASSTTDGFQLQSASAANNIHGTLTLHNISGNSWVASISAGSPAAATTLQGGGGITLAGALDRVRITTPVGTDTFDAGSINIMYEG